MKKIPKEYHSEINVFLRQDADILPDHRDGDHKNELLKDKQVFFIRNYKLLLEQKTDAMKKYIVIRPSLSAMAASILLVRKLEDELRFCMDYKTFNAIMIKNKYLILLINEILGKLSNTK